MNEFKWSFFFFSSIFLKTFLKLLLENQQEHLLLASCADWSPELLRLNLSPSAKSAALISLSFNKIWKKKEMKSNERIKLNKVLCKICFLPKEKWSSLLFDCFIWGYVIQVVFNIKRYRLQWGLLLIIFHRNWTVFDRTATEARLSLR